VIDGKKKDHAWLLDPLYDGGVFKKWSGTDGAGINTEDLAGMTCDALAHFSLVDSEGSLVLVDIQGKSNLFLSLRCSEPDICIL
jgi:Alpha-kinase family